MITTDGMENASREFNYRKLNKMIEDVKEMYGWEFLFLGANIDATKEAARFGIRPERTVRFNSDSKGTRINYQVMDKAITSMRANQSLDANWKQEVEEDYIKRG